MTLKFKSSYCPRHMRNKKSFFSNFFSKSSPLFRLCSPFFKINKSLLIPTSEETSKLDGYGTNNSKLKNRKGMIDDQSMMDDLNTTCPTCLSEESSFREFSKTREQLYNEQPCLMFKYHIGMCSVIFMSVATILFISDLNK